MIDQALVGPDSLLLRSAMQIIPNRVSSQASARRSGANQYHYLLLRVDESLTSTRGPPEEFMAAVWQNEDEGSRHRIFVLGIRLWRVIGTNESR